MTNPYAPPSPDSPLPEDVAERVAAEERRRRRRLPGNVITATTMAAGGAWAVVLARLLFEALDQSVPRGAEGFAYVFHVAAAVMVLMAVAVTGLVVLAVGLLLAIPMLITTVRDRAWTAGSVAAAVHAAVACAAAGVALYPVLR